MSEKDEQRLMIEGNFIIIMSVMNKTLKELNSPLMFKIDDEELRAIRSQIFPEQD